MRRWVALLLLATAIGQQPIEFTPYTNAWTMRLVGENAGADSTPLLWEDRLETVTWHGRAALKREQVEHRLVPVGGWQRITNVFDPATLAPLMTETRQRNGAFDRLEYDGVSIREVRSARYPGGGSTDSTVTERKVSGPFLDFYGGMYALVLAHLPLAAGSSGNFPALVLPDTIVQVPWRVAGREKVRGVKGEQVLAYRVEAGIATGPGSAGGVFTAWVVDRPPYVLRLTTPGARGGVWSWDEIR